MTDLQTRIADLLDDHADWIYRCNCGHQGGYSEHLAQVIITELRLSVDRGVIIGCDGGCAVGECGCPNWKADDEGLRTRIAKALYGQITAPVPLFDDQSDEVQSAWLADADAVIRELKLKREDDPTPAEFADPANWHPIEEHPYLMTDDLRTRPTTMSDPLCTHRWDRGDSTEPGPCQCQRWANHDGPHRCCCGGEADE